MKLVQSIPLILLIALTVIGQTDPAKEVAAWRTAHEAEISAPDSWLSLAGLFQLKDGENSIGTGLGFDIQLTDSFKGGRFGSIAFSMGKATLTIEPGVEAFADGKRFTELELKTDESGPPTTVSFGSQTFFLIKRGDRVLVRLRDQNRPALREFKGLRWFKYDRRYRVVATLEKFDTEKEIAIPNVLGGNIRMKSPGILKFSLRGKEFALQPVWEKDRLFIIFRDETSRTTTYGAGRFLYAKPEADGRIILDFNKSENPPCAFTTFATCPLPPPQNRLKIEIQAGEKKYDEKDQGREGEEVKG